MDEIQKVLGSYYMKNKKTEKIDEMFPDLEATFESSLSREALLCVMQNIADVHVARQTLQPIDKYTGERDYDLDDIDPTTLSPKEKKIVNKLAPPLP
jgi:hypothetical protein